MLYLVMALAVVLQITVAALARSLKEAQILLGLLPLLPTLPGIAAALNPYTPQLWTACIPVFGQMVMYTRLIAGVELELGQALLSALVTLGCAVLIFRWAGWLYERESVVIGR